MQAFDNYNKHIKTILVTVKNSFIFGDNNEFLIKQFIYDGVVYEEANALDKLRDINSYVIKTVNDILLEVKKQIPNCIDNSKRIQLISFKQQVKKSPQFKIDYISFFIDIEENINELPNEIKVLPLIVKPNNQIYSFDFKFDKIFIKKKGCEECEIIGCAELKDELENNEIYKKFKVRVCDKSEYIEYISNFSKKYPKVSINYYAMEVRIVILD